MKEKSLLERENEELKAKIKGLQASLAHEDAVYDYFFGQNISLCKDNEELRKDCKRLIQYIENLKENNTKLAQTIEIHLEMLHQSLKFIRLGLEKYPELKEIYAQEYEKILEISKKL